MNNNEVNNQEVEQNENKELNNQILNQELISNETKNVTNQDKQQKRETNFIVIILALFFTISIAAIVYNNHVMEMEKEQQIRDRANENRNANNNRTNNNPVIEDKTEDTEEKNEEKKKEYKITNKKTADDVKESNANKAQEIQNKINEKIGESIIILNFLDLYDNSNYKLSEISDGIKIRLLTNYMIYNENYSLGVTDEEKKQQYNYKISLSKLKELYEKIYGQTIEINNDLFKNIKYPIDNKNSSGMMGTWLYCPAFDKIENDNIYFNNRCGGSSNKGPYILTYDFKEQNDTIEIYQAVAYTIKFYEDKEYYTEVYTDSDYSESSLYDTFIQEEHGNFQLNELNKDKFNNYKITFKKNDKGNYIFEQAELIK